jgi:arylsulfatase A-like enzyme
MASSLLTPWTLSASLLVALTACGERGGPPAVEPSAQQAPASAASEPSVSPVPLSQGQPQHVVVILIDTLRADALAAAETPNIDALAASGLMVERAWSTTTWTVPAVISLFTGSFVRTHGWDLPTGDMTHRPQLPSLPTLAEVLKQGGFETQGLYANGYLAHELGFSRGFDEWKRSTDSRMPQEVARRVEAWASSPTADQDRHFLYLHLLGIHSGLAPSQEARERHGIEPEWFSERVGLLIGRAKRDREPGVREAYDKAYHAVVEDMDARVGEILGALGPARDDCLVVILSDHGEELGEHGAYGHGWSVAEALTHVPMIVAGPGVEPGQRSTATIAELGDLITDAVGIDHPWPVQSPWDGPLVAERHGKQAVLVGGRFKGTWHGDELVTYDLEADPRGLWPAPGSEELVEQGMKSWAQTTPAGEPLTDHVELDPRTLEAVKALGYVD